MGLFFRNWHDEGFYEIDEYDTVTKLENSEDIICAKKEGRLYEHDGMGMTYVDKKDEIDLNDVTRRNNKGS